MSSAPRRILYRIILPFTLLFGLMSFLYGGLSVYFFSHYIDQTLTKQMAQVAGVITNVDFALNPAILQQVKNIVEADIIVIDSDGGLIGSTFVATNTVDAQQLMQFVKLDRQQQDVEHAKISYRVMNFPVQLGGSSQIILSLWKPLNEVRLIKLKIYWGIIGVAVLGIIAMSIAGFIIARSITAPVEKLVVAAENIASGDLEQQVPPHHHDEIGRLANSFNHMVEQLKGYEKKLVETEKIATAGQLAAGFAHEIRNPLTSIKMFGQMLQQRLAQQPENQKMLGAMVEEINRLDRVIQDVISRTRPGELQRELHDLNRQLMDVITLAAASLEAQGVQVEEDFTLLPKVLIDAEKIKQVLWNLLLNARDAMPAGGLCRISTAMIDDNWIMLLVEDEGQGISASHAEQIFTPFYTTKPEGMGLGLSMCRKIIEQHGGTVTLSNRPARGVVVEVVLPVGGSCNG